MTGLSASRIPHSGGAQMQPVTLPARTPDPRGEQVEFHLTPAERAAAARIQAHLRLHRNDPQKRRPHDFAG